ncbi:N-acetylmuramoyl-L-alanine amidase [Hymenobacter daecheongensis DSM 21074]|uniref:N-acetylmuramoyl-L-alanine amidase n=1 Tax=Hymenobacter daecheongensis DSM 21074 TaxID=1121955 RepID=A0A1M6LXH3_9BACT|nr:N-acetylmuramoyl-L-alanine amidase [Hymenobacter daecheongensis]SHJ75862.1 N-acetylmuramoyl-L-alanine amidase [Hymenobacter daecheongensis DSM 21074]
MRTITHIVLHCTACPQSATVASILNYWRQELGWKTPGYHIIIPPDGCSQRLVPDEQVSNGVAGHNARSLHVSYIGGVDGQGRPLDNRTPAQLAEMERIVRRWKAQHPNAQVVGHRDFPGVTKACPCFDALTWWASVTRK